MENISDINIPVIEHPKSAKEIVDDLLKNEKIREQCVINANQINKKMHGNWFTIEQMVKKTNFVNPDAAKDMLDLFCLFGLCFRKQVEEDFYRYKITIDAKGRLQLLHEELQEAKGHVLMLESEIEKIELKLAGN